MKYNCVLFFSGPQETLFTLEYEHKDGEIHKVNILKVRKFKYIPIPFKHVTVKP